MAAKTNSTAQQRAPYIARARLAGMRSMTLADAIITVCQCSDQFDDAECLAEAVESIARRQSQLAALIVNEIDAGEPETLDQRDKRDLAVSNA